MWNAQPGKLVESEIIAILKKHFDRHIVGRYMDLLKANGIDLDWHQGRCRQGGLKGLFVRNAYLLG